MALDLIAPAVPTVENKGPELFLQGLGQGLAAFSRFAEAKRKSESDMAELALKERMSQEAHDLDLKKIEAQAPLIDAHTKYYNALSDLSVSKANAYANNTATAAQRAIAFNQQREQLVNDVNDQVSALKLNDPEFATKEPVKFAANVMQFKDMFGLSPLPEVKNAIKQFQSTADQQKVPLRIGAQFDEEKGAWTGGKTQMVPIWQVVRNVQDPNQRDETLNALKASGHITDVETQRTVKGTPTKSFSRPLDSIWDFVVGPTDRKETIKTQQFDPLAKRIDAESKNVRFEHVPSKVPAAMLPKSAATGTAPTELPAPDLPPDGTMDESLPDPQASASPQFNPTDTDVIIGHAKAAIAKGAPQDAVAARLQGMGIDPQVLYDSAA